MRYLFGFIFLLLSIWQFIMFRRAFTNLKEKGNQGTSPFILLGLWSGLVFAIIFFIVAINCFFADFSTFL